MAAKRDTAFVIFFGLLYAPFCPGIASGLWLLLRVLTRKWLVKCSPFAHYMPAKIWVLDKGYEDLRRLKAINAKYPRRARPGR